VNTPGVAADLSHIASPAVSLAHVLGEESKTDNLDLGYYWLPSRG
jgi:hypothetical protein